MLAKRYRLVREIGRGGMGVVWLAQDTTLDDREVALKLLPTALTSNARAIARLKKEATTCLDLTHTHIVRLINFEQDTSRGGIAFLVMQYVQGKTLDDVLVDHPQGLPLDRVTTWATQVAEALDHAHAQRILHRDIKPSNIMIDERGNAYLMDFGIAREAKDTMTRVTGRDSSGTLPYMSPQQVDGINSTSNDIYSLAATLYEAIKGEPPFTTGDISHQIHNRPVLPIDGQPGYVNDALLAGLAKDADDRPITAGELVAALSGDAGLSDVHRTHRVRLSSEQAQAKSPVVVASRLKVQAEEHVKRLAESRSGHSSQGELDDIHSELAVAETVFTTRAFDDAARAYAKVIERCEVIVEMPLAHGDTFTNSIGMELVYIEPGTFMMGSPEDEEARCDNEGPQHRVTLTSGFYMGVTEVTRAQWKAVTRRNPGRFRFRGNDLPVVRVSWKKAVAFCEKLSRLEGRTYRLPTEAEWEYACRAGTTTAFNTGATISTDQANYDGDFTYGSGRKGVYRAKTTTVGSFPANAWGLHDMHGNVYELCQDVWHDSYSGAPTDGSAWTRGGDQSRRVLRGGSWNDGPRFCRSANRNWDKPDYTVILNGFRVCLD